MEDGVKLELPGNVAARPPEPADLGAVIEVVAASELAATGVADVTLEDVRSDWQRPSFDLARDAVVVTDGGRVVAYAEVFAGRAWVHVHPEARGRSAPRSSDGPRRARGSSAPRSSDRP
jgi:hypothetical protein